MARKRLLVGIAMALYGLSIFNLHYWGFGIPFILGGAWYLVRAHPLSEKLKYAKARERPAPQPAAARRAWPATVEALYASCRTGPTTVETQAGQGGSRRG